MRTLALFSAILLVALQAQADPLPETFDKVQVQEQAAAENPDVAISFAGDEISAFQVSDLVRGINCRCFPGSCLFPERSTGFCLIRGIRYSFCCR
ncbi:defensin-5-like [Tupaia chinensis]|nr:defensin-5-like [Tupaia chinensis]